MKRFVEKIRTILPSQTPELYPVTYSSVEGLRVICSKADGQLCVIVDGSKAFRFEGRQLGGPSGIRMCPMNRGNRRLLNREFPYTAPAALGAGENVVLLTGAPAEMYGEILEEAAKKKLRPVLVRQNPLVSAEAEESFETAVDLAAWNVFRHSFRSGYGVCIDGIRSEEELEAALKYSVSMISLDLSSAEGRVPEDEEERRALYLELPEEYRTQVERDFLEDGRPEEDSITADRKTLEETVLRYREPAELASRCRKLMRRSMRRLDLELSMAGFSEPVSEFAHCFIARELEKNGAKAEAVELKLPLDPEDRQLQAQRRVAAFFGHRIKYE